MVKFFKYINICFLLLISSCAFNPSLNSVDSIQIITTNDIHGMLGDQDAVFMNPDFPPKIIGAAGYQKYVEDLKRSMNSKDVLIFDSGNFFQGHPLGISDSGKTVIKWMNQVGYNALVPAQTDFLFGYKNLINLSKIANFPFLASNLVYQENDSLVFNPYIIIETENKKIWVLGIVPSNLDEILLKNNIRGLKIINEISTLEKWIPEIKNDGVDAIILLSSLGIPWDREEVYDDFIATKIDENINEYKCKNSLELGYFSEGIDVILSGGVSKGYNTPWYDPNSHVYIFQNYGNLTGFGHFEMNFDKQRKAFSGFSYVVTNQIQQTLFLDDFDYNIDNYNNLIEKVNASINDVYAETNWEESMPPDNKGIEYLENDKKDNWNVPAFNSEYENTIATWNCEFFPTAGDSTIEALSEIVKDMQIDIIAFQEIKKQGWFYKLMENLPNYNFIISKQSSFMDQAFIYKKDKYELVNSIELFAESDYNFAGRPPLKCDFINKFNNNKISLINLHMKCCDSGLERRKKASQMLYKYLDKLVNSNDVSYIVLGDWNDDLKDEENEHCFSSFLNDERYYFPTEEITYDIKQASYPKEPYVSFLDHIMVTNDLIDTNYKVNTILMDQYMGGFETYESYISDHLPVLFSFD